MDELVIAQGILLAETFMARWAFKRFFTIMCHHVHVQSLC
jgi:hypothetical protein